MKKNEIILFLGVFFLGFGQNCHSQNHIPFRNCLNEATYWFYEQEFDSANYYFSKAEKYKIDFYVMESHLYSRTLWELGEKKKSKKILLRGGVSNYFKKDSTYYKGMSSNCKHKILKKIPSIDEKMTPKNVKLFDSLNYYDQLYRKQLAEIAFDKNNPKFANLVKKMNYQDSINQYNLIKYIKTFGYPAGYKHADASVSTVILHSSSEWLMENYTLFINEISHGRMDSWAFSEAIDRYFGSKNCRNQTPYNTYRGMPESKSTKPELVFINSCSIGLDPYFENINYRVYPRGLKPRKSPLYDYYKKNKKYFNCSQF